MQFNNYYFILYFLPLMLVLYFTLGKINNYTRKLIIILGSFVFYAWADLKLSLVLVCSLIVNFAFAKLSEKKSSKLPFVIPIILNIGLLLFFKYTNFAISNINSLFQQNLEPKNWVLPLGISFFTFSQISYITGIHKKELTTNLLDYLAYVLYFPKLIMGPIMEPSDFFNKLNDESLKSINWDNIAYGVKIFSFGLFKKVVLADVLGGAVVWGFSNFDDTTAVDWLLLMLIYTFEIYFDCSGYTDMAMGSSIMFNIELPINFDSPYKSTSFSDFWRRWHISLSKFWIKYIYIPLGGSRKGEFITCVNLMIIFLVSGLWHGANWTYILWGAIYGTLSIIERITPNIPINKITKPFKILWTFVVTNFFMILFRSDSVTQWLDICKKIAHFEERNISNELMRNFNIPESAILFNAFPVLAELKSNFKGLMMCVFIVVSCIICFIPENNYRNLKKLSAVSMVFAAIALIWGITCLGGESVFVYNGF